MQMGGQQGGNSAAANARYILQTYGIDVNQPGGAEAAIQAVQQHQQSTMAPNWIDTTLKYAPWLMLGGAGLQAGLAAGAGAAGAEGGIGTLGSIPAGAGASSALPTLGAASLSPELAAAGGGGGLLGGGSLAASLPGAAMGSSELAALGAMPEAMGAYSMPAMGGAAGGAEGGIGTLGWGGGGGIGTTASSLPSAALGTGELASTGLMPNVMAASAYSLPEIGGAAALGTAAASQLSNYGNEGANYPTESTTQGPGGSPINASQVASALPWKDILQAGTIAAGALAGSQPGGGGTATTQSRTDPRIDPYIYGDDGLLAQAKQWYQANNGPNANQQAGWNAQLGLLNDPAAITRRQQMSQSSMGLLSTPVAGNGFGMPRR